MSEDQNRPLGTSAEAASAAVFVEASRLITIAQEAYKRIDAQPDDRSWGHHDALIAVVFAAAALEAFLNELGELAQFLDTLAQADPILPGAPSGPVVPPTVARCAQLLDTAEASRASLELKYMLASLCLTGEMFERSRQPFQDFALLIGLRNSVVHLKGQGYSQGMSSIPDREARERIIDRLRSKNILAKLPQDHKTSLGTWISTPAVASWACNTAATMVRVLLEMIPDGFFRQRLNGFYWEAFSPVE